MGYVIQLLVAFLAIVQLRFVILGLVLKLAGDPEPSSPVRSAQIPKIAIQVAAYREAPALPKLLTAIGGLDWPSEFLLIQVLDDSMGQDAKATQAVTEEFAGRGVPVQYLNRHSRDGFKAGALNHGLAFAGDAELIAYFDADCRPRSDFLTRIVPKFSDPHVAAVQGRWEYPNGPSSPLTTLQQAAFEYLFRYEYGIRSRLGSPVYYLGSAAVWRRRALEELGGWKVFPLTAEDVDMGCRAGNNGWKLLYEPGVVADNDAIEEILAFRAQQRRWAFAVSQAGLDASIGVTAAPWGIWARILDLTAFLPHSAIPLTLLIGLLVAIQSILYAELGHLLNVTLWIFTWFVIAPPAVIVIILAMRYFHPQCWRAQVKRLLAAGPVIAAAMTSFIFGLAELARGKRIEFISTPKAGQVAVVSESKQRWLSLLYGPVVFDILSATLLLTGAGFAMSRGALQAAIPTTCVGAAFIASAVQSISAVRKHQSKLSVPAASK